MKKVITYGSFDLFHEGHYRLLERAKALGDYLIVGVTTEQYDASRGKLNIVNSLMERIESVRKTGLADEIIIEDHVGQKIEDVIKYNIDIFTVGSDWIGVFEYMKEYCDVIYLERTQGISSTMLRSNKYKFIRLGIIGTGRIARRFIKEAKYVSGTQVECVYNPRLESASRFGEEFDIDQCTDDINEFLEKVDAVYIASPHNTHYTYIIKALENGKHVLCEKPMTLNKEEAQVAYELAKEKNLILLEAIKTAYTPGFLKLISLAKSGSVGKVCDVEAAFTKLVQGETREMNKDESGGSFTELGSYPLLVIFKMLGTDYKDVRFECFVDNHGVDTYTKVYLKYETGMATAKVGLGVKSEGELIISGTKGYLICEAPWWKTEHFEVRYEDITQNEKFFVKLLGEGLRYEISDFVALINGQERRGMRVTATESIAIADLMEKFLSGYNREDIYLK